MRDKSVSKTRSTTWLRPKNKIEKTHKKKIKENQNKKQKQKWLKNCMPKLKGCQKRWLDINIPTFH